MRKVVVGLVTALVVAAVMAQRYGVLPALGAGGDGGYAFMGTQPAQATAPVTYSSCKPIRVELNLAGAKDQDEAKRVILEALGEVSAATHLSLVYVGDSTRRPRWPDPTLTLEGGAWPVLIGFGDRSDVPNLKEHVAGVGGSTYVVSADGRKTYVTGNIALEKGYFNQLFARGEHDEARAIVMHELGHVVGLDHVDSTHELMNPTAGHMVHFGRGDRRGLRLLGQGPCV